MENKYMCYVTYAIALDELPQIPPFIKENALTESPQTQILPIGFMPQWFQAGGFPEDEAE